MAEAVVFAMLASFILTYTLVPTMAKYVLKAHHATGHEGGVFARFQHGFQVGFERFRDRYAALLDQAVAHRVGFVAISMVVSLVSLVLFAFEGQEFFPKSRGAPADAYAGTSWSTHRSRRPSGFACLERYSGDAAG